MKIVQGKLQGQGYKFAIVVGRFNEFITSKLLSGCEDCLLRHGVEAKDITAIWVPGSFEIPLVANAAALSNQYDAVICLGAVIRGATPHFDYVAAEVSKGIASVSMETKLPVIYGVLTTDSIEQAIERAGTKSGNKGVDAAMTALEMTDLMKQLLTVAGKKK